MYIEICAGYPVHIFQNYLKENIGWNDRATVHFVDRQEVL
jgi:hypothetical protein